jgi:oligopeptide/dipeptide ABC transporter ATP-binding protein
MCGGKKAEEATPSDLFYSMHHPYAQALLASMPNLENTTEHALASIAGLPPDPSKETIGCRFAPRCEYATDQCHREDPPLTTCGDRA